MKFMTYLKDQYGQWISYDPEFNKKTFILWGIDLLLFYWWCIIYKKINFKIIYKYKFIKKFMQHINNYFKYILV